eukprot:Gb_36361 [translate_table: standard]
MIMDAERMCMRVVGFSVSTVVKQTVLAKKHWVLPTIKGYLYICPLLISSGSILGLDPTPEFTFLIYVSHVVNYFKGTSSLVEIEYHHATPGATRGIKTIGNYAPILKTQYGAKAKGYSNMIYLDAINKKYLKEVSSCNIFVLKDNIISTPTL